MFISSLIIGIDLWRDKKSLVAGFIINGKKKKLINVNKFELVQ